MFDQLIPRIPLLEAADFFHRVKHAGWDEPPDMAGALEGQFAAPVEQVVQQITEIVTLKFRIMVAYYTFAESMRDLAQHPIGEVFHEHAGHELEAAEYYLKRAAVLGGAIHLNPIEPPPASTDPVHIIQTMIRAEQEAIANQRHLRQLVGDDNPMKIEIEEKLAQDQHHLDELWQMLPSELHGGVGGAEAAAGPAEAAPEAVEAAPMADPAAKMAAEHQHITPEIEANLREVGKSRAITQLASEAHREKGRKHERFDELAGRAAGAIGGAYAGRKLIGGRSGAIAGLAAGYGVGGKLGKEVGVSQDIRKNASAGLTPEEAAAVHQHQVANHLYLDPLLGLQGAQLGGLFGHPLAGAGIGAGLGALASHGFNKHLDRSVLEAQSGKMPSFKRKSMESMAEGGGDHVVPLMALLGGVTGGLTMGLPGAAVGGLAGANLGSKALGSNRALVSIDRRAREQGLEPKVAAMRFKLASIKLGFGPDLGTYMAANQAGQQAQGEAEANFYREKVRSMEQASGASQQQITDMQAQLQQLQEQTAQSGAAIQAASQEATMARDDALAQTQAAANMRIGYQKLRQQIIESASQDPETMMMQGGGLPGDLPPGSGNGIAPAMQPGMPGASPEAVPPGVAPAGAGAPGAPGEAQAAAGSPPGPDATAQPNSELKTAGAKDVSKKVLDVIKNHPGYVAGGLAGGAGGAHHALKPAREHDKLMNDVHDAVTSRKEGDSLDVAKKLIAYDKSSKAKANPIRTALKGGLRGAVLGAAAGDQLQSLGRNIRSIP